MYRYVLAIPIAFTSDHIETLYEIDIEYTHAAKEAGITVCVCIFLEVIACQNTQCCCASVQMFRRAPALNNEPFLTTAQAELVGEHLRRVITHNRVHMCIFLVCCISCVWLCVRVCRKKEVCTPQYRFNCHGCTNPTCRTVLNPVGGNYNRLRDTYDEPSSVPKWPPQ